MKSLRTSPLLVVVALMGCKKPVAVERAPDSTCTVQQLPLAKDSLPPTSKPAVVVNDTVGVGAFVDSIRLDAKRGSLDFVHRHLAAAINGGNTFSGLWDEGGVFRQDPQFVKATAQLLDWTIGWGGLRIDTLSNKDEDGEWMFFYPSIGRRKVEFEMVGYNDRLAESDQPSCKVFVGDTVVALLDSLGGDLGPIGAGPVCKLQEVGGTKLKGFSGKVRISKMRVKTPDGRKGWMDGNNLRDLGGAGLTLRLVHLAEGWRVADFNLWNEGD